MNPLAAITIGINPEAFTVFGRPIGWYGIMVTLAVITMVVWAIVNVRKDTRITRDMVVNAALVGIPSGIIGARLFHVIDKFDYYIQNPGRIIGGDGLTIWGAVLGTAFGLWIYNRITKHSFAHMADMLAPGIILAQAVGRIGCTILGDDYGSATSLPWGFIYTHPGSPAFVNGLTPTQPVVVYEIIYDLIIFCILMMLRKKVKPEGSLFIIYLGLYAIWRIAGDFMRTNTPFITIGDFHLVQAQVIGIIILVVAVIYVARKTRWVKPGEEFPEALVKPPEEKPAA
jgi:phosphatidylglycerol---prolipoprotein diacylglyceryl transferase